MTAHGIKRSVLPGYTGDTFALRQISRADIIIINVVGKVS